MADLIFPDFDKPGLRSFTSLNLNSSFIIYIVSIFKVRFCQDAHCKNISVPGRITFLDEKSYLHPADRHFRSIPIKIGMERDEHSEQISHDW